MHEITRISPFRCRLWDQHGRMEELISEENCREEIQSMRDHGQLVPILGRRLGDTHSHELEIICGARRLFAAKCLNIEVLVEIRQLTDREAIVMFDVENRLRREWSAYERGRSFARWLSAGMFSSQDDIARALNISTSQVSRLLKMSKLPSIVVEAFSDPSEICENWGLDLHSVCSDPERRPKLIARARALAKADKRVPRDTFALLMRDTRLNTARPISRQEVVLSRQGKPLFRIRHQEQSLSLIIEKRQLPSEVMVQIKEAVSSILEDSTTIECAGRLRHRLAASATSRDSDDHIRAQ